MKLSKPSYFIGLILILFFSYSQYLVNVPAVLDSILVYGIPIIIASFLFGRAIIKRFFNATGIAFKFGFAYFSAISIITIILGEIIYYFLSNFDSSAINLLHRPNPVLNVSPEFAWIMVAASLFIIGPIEEYVFRGYIYGGMLSVFGSRHWLGLAFISSLIFAAAHLYYAFLYGLASSIAFVDLIGIGMILAITYYLSGGNLFVPALIHGLYDATGFLGIAISIDFSLYLRIFMIWIGLMIGLVVLARKLSRHKIVS